MSQPAVAASSLPFGYRQRTSPSPDPEPRRPMARLGTGKALLLKLAFNVVQEMELTDVGKFDYCHSEDPASAPYKFGQDIVYTIRGYLHLKDEWSTPFARDGAYGPKRVEFLVISLAQHLSRISHRRPACRFEIPSFRDFLFFNAVWPAFGNHALRGGGPEYTKSAIENMPQTTQSALTWALDQKWEPGLAKLCRETECPKMWDLFNTAQDDPMVLVVPIMLTWDRSIGHAAPFFIIIHQSNKANQQNHFAFQFVFCQTQDEVEEVTIEAARQFAATILIEALNQPGHPNGNAEFAPLTAEDQCVFPSKSNCQRITSRKSAIAYLLGKIGNQRLLPTCVDELLDNVCELATTRRIPPRPVK